MSRALLAGLTLAVAAVGCGGALSSPDGGAGTGAGGIMSGGAGTTGVGGTAGRSPYEGAYVWGQSSVYVGPTGTRPDSFTYTAQEDIVLEAMATLPAATDYPPTNGARLKTRFGCATAAPYAVDVYSCASSQDGTTPPGCITFTLNDQGVMTGGFVDAAGTPCIVQSGSANLLVPLPDYTLPAGTVPRDAATGGFSFFCNRPDGALWYVGGTFAIPATATYLLCSD